jgi:oxalate decarboxylase/phosphoglucose isomerase-like protein (cupin superfamily)
MRRSILYLFLTAVLSAQSPSVVEITAEPHHHQVLVNDQVRVFTVDVPAHSETLMHSHRHDYVQITQQGAQIVNAVEGKSPVSTNLADGDVRFVSAPFSHILRNLSPKPFRDLNIELLQDAKLRSTPTKWDEDRGLDILHGGTKEILFVRDSVRVSLLELQPGGMVPLHQHIGPHLVVALTDYELRSDVQGKPPSKFTMKQGATDWVPGGYSHTLTNTGHTAAKFITVEFH